ncbi:MAG: hypothetical protein A2Y62_17730 [Candidatus Fischerbacteria bacterium RBG_13_37_8]|uniref:Transport permease protein n=1 Tax=Candidatus Fischerbacteria bacterium RBG_13_37_8 TaxID=1817863 RepID=A0A1F5VP89_9BACT|nr:MAG: hypothetical protein A2Y62_17730 [Candidatus Fischerbacteria bacterium RBG_13_37_8]
MIIDKIASFIIKDLKIELSYKLSFILRLLGICVSLLVWYFLARWIGQGILAHSNFRYDYFAFVLIGIASTEFQNSGLKGFSEKLRQNQVTGTLEALLVTPTHPFLILWGNTLWEFFYSFLNSVVFIIIGVVLFGVKITISSIGSVFIALLLSYLAFSSLGVISSSFILLFKKGDPVNFAIAGFSTLLAGVYYPINILPEFLRVIANVMPVTHFLKIMRGLLLDGTSMSEHVASYLYLLVFFIVLLPLSMLVFSYSFKIARRQGTLSHY